MQGLKATTLIFATAAFALMATVSAHAGGKQTPPKAEATELRWDTIAAEGQRFHGQRETKANGSTGNSKNFMAMAMAAREAR